jgi:hypothetical protein
LWYFIKQYDDMNREYEMGRQSLMKPALASEIVSRIPEEKSSWEYTARYRRRY